MIRTEGDALSYVTQLPASGQAGFGSAPHTETHDNVEATHLLCGYWAWPLARGANYLRSSPGRDALVVGDDPLSAYCSLEQQRGQWRLQPLNGHRLLLNGEAVAAGQVLQPGDRVSIEASGLGFSVIAVLPSDAAYGA